MLAAGGTGGHIFPAEALARELLKRGYNVCLMTDPRGGQFSGDLAGVPVYRIRAKKLGGSFLAKSVGAFEMFLGWLQALGKIKKLKPLLVVGFGGYPSVPTVFAAARLGVPVLLHDQNAVIGRANKILAPFAKIIATSFPRVKGMENVKAPTLLTGNPVRPAICALNSQPYPALDDSTPVRLLVMGGSLGAQVFSDVVPKAITLLPEHLRKRLIISQQCRRDDLSAVESAYAMHGINVELATFFHDVPERISAAHLVICRSGASTVAELCAAGRPGIFVPYPHALAGEQQANAECVADSGGGWVIPQKAFTPEALAVRLETLMTMPATLQKTAAAAKALARCEAASNLADLVGDLIDFSHIRHDHAYTDIGTNRAA